MLRLAGKASTCCRPAISTSSIVTATHRPQVSYDDYYHLERYLFDVVSQRYQSAGALNAFDFFCIVIWKANRAKSIVAGRILRKGEFTSLEQAVTELTAQVHKASSPEERLSILMDGWGFRLPMATAVLAVLYPSEFTVYDVRVCNELGSFHGLQSVSKPPLRWKGYQDYKAAVEAATPAALSLRDKDRWLWGKSFASQLERDVKARFGKEAVEFDGDVSQESPSK